jgi:hypothetical protein
VMRDYMPARLLVQCRVNLCVEDSSWVDDLRVMWGGRRRTNN